MQTQSSIEIDCAIDEVFEYTTNHVAEWSRTVVEEEILEEQPGGVGTTFRVVTEEHGRRMEFHGVVTRHESPTRSTVKLTGQQFDIEADYLFEDLSGRTRVTQRATVTGKGFFKVIFLLLGWMMRCSSSKAQQEELGRLKQILETRESAAPSR